VQVHEKSKVGVGLIEISKCLDLLASSTMFELEDTKLGAETDAKMPRETILKGIAADAETASREAVAVTV